MLSQGETKESPEIQCKVKPSQRQIHSVDENKEHLEVVNYVYEYLNKLYMLCYN